MAVLVAVAAVSVEGWRRSRRYRSDRDCAPAGGA